MNRYFVRTIEGKYQHYINEELRATIEAQYWEDYKNSGGYENDPVYDQGQS